MYSVSGPSSDRYGEVSTISGAPMPYLPHFSSSRRVRSGSVSTKTAFAFGESVCAYWIAFTTPRWMSPTSTRTVLVIGGGGVNASSDSCRATSS